MAQSTESMLFIVSLELQVFHEISLIYQNSQDCLENSLNPKLIPKFPRSWQNSQAVAALIMPDNVKNPFGIKTSKSHIPMVQYRISNTSHH